MSTQRNSPEREASTLIRQHKITSPPVSPKSIAESLGISVIEYDLGDDVSGVLIVEKGKATIGYNNHNPKTRQKFTIAHELGHYMLHRSTKGDQIFIDKDFLVKYRSSQQYTATDKQHEQEANAFAAELIMPENFIKSELIKSEYKDLNESEVIEALAKVFGVSVIAMSYRLSNLNI